MRDKSHSGTSAEGMTKGNLLFRWKALVGAVPILVLLAFGGTASAADGDLDPSFGDGGKVTTDFDGRDDEPYALVVQPDGKMVAAGSSCNLITGPRTFYCEETGIVLARYNPDGALDEDFGTGGKVTGDFGSDSGATALALQPDGKIVVKGWVKVGSDINSVLVRYEANGTLDESFGTGGKVTISTHGAALALQPDGKFVVAGATYSNDTQFDFALGRYNADGTLDESFGGEATTDFFGEHDIAYALIVQSDGKIMAAGDAETTGNGDDFALARYNADGSLDASFDGDGKTTTDFDGYGDLAHDLAVQPDGKIVAAGEAVSVYPDPVQTGEDTYTSSSVDFAVARYNTDGTLDASFDGDGKTTTDFRPGYDERAYALALQSDSKLAAAGYSAEGNFGLARYEKNGSLDQSFGTGGKVNTDPVRSGSFARALVVQPDGKLVAAGPLYVAFGRADFFLARFENDNTAPVARDDSYEAGKTLKIPARRGVLENDKGEDLSAELVREPKKGRLALNKSGSFTYKPNNGFSVKDTFTYKATDGTAESEVAKVTVRVKPSRR